MGRKYSASFIADFDGNMMGAATDIMEGEPFEAPMKPFGGIEQLAWSNDSKQIAYTSRKSKDWHTQYLPTRIYTFII